MNIILNIKPFNPSPTTTPPVSKMESFNFCCCSPSPFRNGIVYFRHWIMGIATVVNRGVRKILKTRMTNSIDPDEIVHTESSHLYLHCLQSVWLGLQGWKYLQPWKLIIKMEILTKDLLEYKYIKMWKQTITEKINTWIPTKDWLETCLSTSREFWFNQNSATIYKTKWISDEFSSELYLVLIQTVYW